MIGTRIQTAPRGTYTIGDMSGYELVVFMIILGSLVDTVCYNREITVILDLSVKKQICQATITKNFGTLEFRLNIAILTVTLSTVSHFKQRLFQNHRTFKAAFENRSLFVSSTFLN